MTPRLSRSLKVIGTDTADRSATYDFLLTFHSIAIKDLSRTVSEINGDFSRKIAFFPIPRVYRAPAEWGSPWNWLPPLIVKILPGRERILTISSAVWIQYTNVQTDGQGRQQRPRLRIASRGKINCRRILMNFWGRWT